jgi:hypothetical protein
MRTLSAILILLFGVAQETQAQLMLAIPDSGFVTPWDFELTSNDELFVTGIFAGTVNFNPGGQRITLSAEGEDAFLAKYQHGLCEWAFKIGGPFSDYIFEVEIVDQLIFIHGRSNRPIDLDPGDATVVIQETGGHFIAKYDLMGRFIEAFNLPIQTEDVFIDHDTGMLYITGPLHFSKLNYEGYILKEFQLQAIATNITKSSAGQILLTGSFGDDSFRFYDFDPGPQEALIKNRGSMDIFLTAISNTESHQWTITIGGDEFYDASSVPSGIASGTSVLQSRSGAIYLGGFFGGGRYRFERPGTIDFDPGPNEFNLSSVSYQDEFIAQFDDIGQFQWAKRFSPAANVPLQFIEDASGSIYIAKDGMVSSLDQSGNEMWRVDLDMHHGGISFSSTGKIVVIARINRTTTFEINSTESVTLVPGLALLEFPKEGPIGVSIENPTQSIPGNIIQFDLFPNPSTSQINALLVVSHDQVLQVELMDNIGRLVDESQRIHCHAFIPCSLSVDISAYSPGVYFARTSADSIDVTRPFIVIH